MIDNIGFLLRQRCRKKESNGGIDTAAYITASIVDTSIFPYTRKVSVIEGGAIHKEDICLVSVGEKHPK
jgi:hypothetical protein